MRADVDQGRAPCLPLFFFWCACAAVARLSRNNHGASHLLDAQTKPVTSVSNRTMHIDGKRDVWINTQIKT